MSNLTEQGMKDESQRELAEQISKAKGFIETFFLTTKLPRGTWVSVQMIKAPIMEMAGIIKRDTVTGQQVDTQLHTEFLYGRDVVESAIRQLVKEGSLEQADVIDKQKWAVHKSNWA